MMATALPALAGLADGQTLVISIAAGTPMARFRKRSARPHCRVIRAMPNTPAAVGPGSPPSSANAQTTGTHALAEALLAAVGQVVRLTDEAQIDAVTGVSGSGPAYVFHLIEAMAEAGVAPRGCPRTWRCGWRKATVAGAARLAEQSGRQPATQLRAQRDQPRRHHAGRT